MSKILYGNFIEKEDKRWFWSRSGGGLYSRNKITGEYELEGIYYKNNQIWNGDCLFDKTAINGNYLFLQPRYASDVLIWSFSDKKMISRPLPVEPRVNVELFGEVLKTETEIIMMPQTYQGFLHINKTTMQMRINQLWYKDYCSIAQKAEKDNYFIFRADPVICDGIAYLAFYYIPKILIYHIETEKYLICDTKEAADGLEIYQDDQIKILIINKLNCLKMRDDGLFPPIYEFVKNAVLIKLIDYNGDIYFFTDDNILTIKEGEKELRGAEWFPEIRDDYLNRIRVKGGLQDTLYVFQDEGILFITFELEEIKCIVKICKEKVMIEYEEIEKIDEIKTLLQILDINVYNNETNFGNCVGKAVYKILNQDT